MENEPQIVDVFEIKEDVGFAAPSYKRAKIMLWSDGRVTWDVILGIGYDNF